MSDTKEVVFVYTPTMSFEREDFEGDNPQDYDDDKVLIDTAFDNLRDMMHDWINDVNFLEDNLVAFVRPYVNPTSDEASLTNLKLDVIKQLMLNVDKGDHNG